MNTKQRFPIGLQFNLHRVKHNKERKITDVLKTYNSKGELVKLEYEVMHEFLGQKLFEVMVDTCIARSLNAEQLRKYVE